ncbi:MAG: hypothetical protein ACM3U1_06450 [Chloroflexota bacterium]
MRALFLILTISIISALVDPNASQAQAFRWTEPENARAMNGPNDDFAPSWNAYEGLLYFNSTATGASQFYAYSPKEGGAPKLVRGALNEPGKNRSYIVFTGESEAYLTSFMLYPDRSYQNIFKTKKVKSKWTEPYPADSLGGAFFCSQVTFSPSRRFAIFVTNRASRGKDTDLWTAVRQPNGSWGALIALDELNSEGSEITPFLLGEDTLFFASDGFEGPGAFDIYYSIREGNSWGRPRLAEGLNTAFDESDLVFAGDTLAYFASNRPGSQGGLDIYSSTRALEREAPVTARAIDRLEIQTSSLSAEIRIQEKPFIKPFVKEGSDSLLAAAARPGENVVGTSRTMSVNPPKLEVSLGAIGGEASAWRFEARTDAGDLIDAASGESLPASVLFDLDSAADKLVRTSFIALKLIARTASGEEATEEITLDARRSTEKGGLFELGNGALRARLEIYPQGMTDQEVARYLASVLAALDSAPARANVSGGSKAETGAIKKALEAIAPKIRVRAASAHGVGNTPIVLEFELDAR